MKSVRVILLISWVIIAGMYLSSARAAGNNTEAFDMAQVTDAIVAPNVFTPNGDGENDVFEVKSENDNVVSLKIYTRAGVLIFSIEAKRCRWDGFSLNGQKLAEGVYYYTAEVPGSSPKVAKCGFVHLYR